MMRRSTTGPPRRASCYAPNMLAQQQKLLNDPPVWYPFAVLGGMFAVMLMVGAYNKDDKKRRTA